MINSNMNIGNDEVKKNNTKTTKWNYENLLEIALKYQKKSEFEKNDNAAYASAYRLGFLKDICSHMISNGFFVWDSDKVKETVLKYKDKTELKNNDLKTYRALKERGLIDEFCSHMPKRKKIDEKYRKWTKEKLQEEANKYQTRTDFQINSPTAYTTARINGSLNEICSHMKIKNFSIPQLICRVIFDYFLNLECLYNTRKIIKPYELDLYYKELRFAVEYNGERWHRDEEKQKTDRIKKELCRKNNIKLFVISERSRDYINDVKNQIIENLSFINTSCNTKISKEDIEIFKVDISKYLSYTDTVNKIKEIAYKYNSISLFKKEQKNIYENAKKLKIFEEVTIHMKDDL